MEPRYRILLVDDIVRYHRLYELAITDALPAKVHFATNGEEALDKLASPIPQTPGTASKMARSSA